MSNIAHPHGPLETMIDDVRSHWGWFVALGVILVVLGIVALSNIVAATVASVYLVGVMMSVGGIMHIVQAFGVRSWAGFFLWLLAGLLYLGAGIIVFYNPLMSAAALTLVLAFLLIIAGAFRIGGGIRFRPLMGWGWLVLSGVVTLLAGLLILIGWPINTLYLLGVVLAADLLVQGVTALAFGLAIRPRHHHETA